MELFSNKDCLNPMPADKLNESFLSLSKEAKELYLDSYIQEINIEDIDPLVFFRNWIAPNKPVIIKSAIKHWKAYQNWTHSYLKEKIGEEEVTVAVTPNGFADAPLDGLFVMPEERKMTFSHFIIALEKKKKDSEVLYIQKQNSNLTEEFGQLIDDVDVEVEWFSKALGKEPDAVNFWMGDERAITSMHKDNYENIYCVVRGHKDFVLLPPTDLPWVPYKLYPPAKYQSNSEGDFSVVPLSDAHPVPWICIDPLNPDLEAFPQYKNATPIRCRVKEGDALYLPSLWFHHVRQSHGCIAVNFWYDMEFDLKYNYYRLVQNLTWKDIPNI